MDGIEPELLDNAQAALERTPGVLSVPKLQLPWVGHRLQGAATIVVANAALSAVEETVGDARHQLGHALPKLDDVVIQPVTGPAS